MDINDPLAIAEGNITALRLELCYTLEKLRKEKGLTKKRLAQMLGITRKQVSNLESPFRNHAIEDLMKYLAVLGHRLELNIHTAEQVIPITEKDL